MVVHDGEVPPPLLFFTAVVCTSVMANFTLLVPVSTYYSATLLESGVIVSSYAGGALVSLYFWSTYDRYSIRPAYVAQAAIMCGGNALFAAVCLADLGASTTFYGLLAARFVVGLEAGAMYNANLALVGYSAAEHRVRYLAMYQSFVGVGLVLGPAISSSCLAVAEALGSAALEESLSAVVMAAWGACVLAAVAARLPDDAALEAAYGRPAASGLDDDDKGRAPAPGLFGLDGRDSLLGEIFLGNLLRIYQRLGWEVGAVVVLADNYGWGYIAAGYSLSAFGFAQAAGQYAFAVRAGAADPGTALDRLEFVEGLAIGALFTLATAAGAMKGFLNAVFVAASLVFYLANCLTSAPYNALILDKAAGLDREEMLLASQYGINFALGLAPIVVRGAMEAVGSPGDEQNTLAAVLLCGWAAQTVLNGALTGRVASALVATLGLATAALVFWAMLDKGVGGTGWANVFSWHPVLMALAFFAAMTLGQLAYKDDFGPAPNVKEDRRRVHGALMALAFVLAAAGYCFIFTAHEESGESQVGTDETWSRAVHVWMGYPTLLWLVVQATAGALKARTLEVLGERTFKWHGASGEYLLVAGYLTSLWGFWLKFNYRALGGWNTQLKLALTALTAALLGLKLLPAPRLPPLIDAADADATTGLLDAAKEAERRKAAAAKAEADADLP